MWKYATESGHCDDYLCLLEKVLDLKGSEKTNAARPPRGLPPPHSTVIHAQLTAEDLPFQNPKVTHNLHLKTMGHRFLFKSSVSENMYSL